MDMVEKVARALCVKHYSERFQKPVTDDHVAINVDANYRLFLDEARVAIEAMREPTDGMADQGDRECGEYGCSEMRMKYIWRSMIDAALAEKPNAPL